MVPIKQVYEKKEHLKNKITLVIESSMGEGNKNKEKVRSTKHDYFPEYRIKRKLQHDQEMVWTDSVRARHLYLYKENQYSSFYKPGT